MRSRGIPGKALRDSGVFPEIFRNFPPEISAVPGAWPRNTAGESGNGEHKLQQLFGPQENDLADVQALTQNTGEGRVYLKMAKLGRHRFFCFSHFGHIAFFALGQEEDVCIVVGVLACVRFYLEFAHEFNIACQ